MFFEHRFRCPRLALECRHHKTSFISSKSPARKSTSCTAIERAEDAEKIPVYRSLAMRAASGRYAHHERASQRYRYESQEQRPAKRGAQDEKSRGNGEAQNGDFNEERLPSLEDSKNVQFEIPCHCAGHIFSHIYHCRP